MNILQEKNEFLEHRGWAQCLYVYTYVQGKHEFSDVSSWHLPVCEKYTNLNPEIWSLLLMILNDSECFCRLFRINKTKAGYFHLHFVTISTWEHMLVEHKCMEHELWGHPQIVASHVHINTSSVFSTSLIRNLKVKKSLKSNTVKCLKNYVQHLVLH